MRIKGILLLFIMASGLYADKITIYNKTNKDVFAGTYYYSKNMLTGNVTSERVGDIKMIEAKSKSKMKRPPLKIGKDRKLVFSTKKSYLKRKPKEKDYKLVEKIGIGKTRGNEFYFYKKGKNVKGYNKAEWLLIEGKEKVIDVTKSAVSKAVNAASNIKDAVDKANRVIKNHIRKKSSASIRRSGDIPLKEKEFLENREAVVRKAMEEAFGDAGDIPRIAMCFSGGGYRAMIATIGFLLGAEDINLLNMTTYTASLSGSTWTIAPWTSYGLTLEEYKKHLIKKVGKDFKSVKETPISAEYVLTPYTIKKIKNQPTSLVDLYGGLLANKLLKGLDKKAWKANISETQAKVVGGGWPLPIYTSVKAPRPYEWIEITPFETGSDYLGGYIPTWALGRHFEKGKSKDYAPEQTLGFMMGIFGSSFAAGFKDIYREIEGMITPDDPSKFFSLISDATEKAYNTVKTGMSKLPIGRDVVKAGEEARVSHAKVHNYTKGWSRSPMKDDSEISMVDAGLFFNIPVPPLLRPERDIEVIIVCDASMSEIGVQLQRLEDYAKEKGIKLPKISYDNITRPVSIFKGSKAEGTPTIVYVPLVKNPSYSKKYKPLEVPYASTYNFKYSEKQFNELSGIMRHTVKEYKDEIFDAIEERINAPEVSTVVTKPTPVKKPRMGRFKLPKFGRSK